MKSYFLKLIKGEHTLKTTFWVWFILLSIILEVIFSLILSQNEYYEYDNQYSEVSIYVFTAIYSILILIAIFKSANKFKGSKLWVFLSKVIVTINLFLSISILIETLQYYYLDDYSINQEIAFFKDNLPVKVDENTELVDINKEDKTIFYTYKFYNIHNLNKHEIRKLKKQVQNSLCDEEGTLTILKKDYILDYTYINKDEKELLEVKTDKTACGENIYDLDILREVLSQEGDLVN